MERQEVEGWDGKGLQRRSHWPPAWDFPLNLQGLPLFQLSVPFQFGLGYLISGSALIWPLNQEPGVWVCSPRGTR